MTSAWLVRAEQKQHSAQAFRESHCADSVRQRGCPSSWRPSQYRGGLPPLPAYDSLLKFARLCRQAMPESGPVHLKPVQPSLLSLLTFKRIGYAHLNVRIA